MSHATDALRVVLDTNIWLDWMVFRDPSINPLEQAVAASRIQLVCNEICLDELARVLAYDRFSLPATKQTKLLAQVRQCVDLDENDGALLPRMLPPCTDPDDQKFLELALNAQVDWLVTKDRALLTLARKKYRLTAFRIGTLTQLTAEFPL
jgi:putative PIN family toxin of toxin-antitoxin system